MELGYEGRSHNKSRARGGGSTIPENRVTCYVNGIWLDKRLIIKQRISPNAISTKHEFKILNYCLSSEWCNIRRTVLPNQSSDIFQITRNKQLAMMSEAVSNNVCNYVSKWFKRSRLKTFHTIDNVWKFMLSGV